MFSRVLATIPVYDKKAETTKRELNNILTEFQLNQKFKYIVSDNASAMKSAFREEQWISCSAHNINLIHKHSFSDLIKLYESKYDDLIERIKENTIVFTINKCKDLVTYFKQSGLQTELDQTLKKAIEIRWDSTLLMLESINNAYEAINRLSLHNNKIKEIIAKIDLKLLNELIEFLKPLYRLRLDLCKENEPTFHSVLSTKHAMFEFCKPKNGESEKMSELKTMYRKSIEFDFKINELHFVGAMLYPPIKHFEIKTDNKNIILATPED